MISGPTESYGHVFGVQKVVFNWPKVVPLLIPAAQLVIGAGISPRVSNKSLSQRRVTRKTSEDLVIGLHRLIKVRMMYASMSWIKKIVEIYGMRELHIA